MSGGRVVVEESEEVDVEGIEVKEFFMDVGFRREED